MRTLRLLIALAAVVGWASAATIVSNAVVTGNWTDGATWVGGVAPTAADDAQVVLTSGTITINSGSVCRSADFTGTTATIAHTAGVAWAIGTSSDGLGDIALTMVSGMTYSPSADTCSITFISSSNTDPQTITWAGKTPGNVTFNGSGGKWQVVDAFATRSATTTTVTLSTGTLDLNGQTCTWGLFNTNSSGVRTLTMGASAITLGSTTTSNGAWDSGGSLSNLTVTANTATVTLNGAASKFFSSAKNWNGLTLVLSGSGNVSTLCSGSTFANVTRTITAAKVDFWMLTDTLVVTGTLTLTGNSVINRLKLYSSVVGTRRVITKTGATMAVSNTDFYDIGFDVSTDLSAATGGTGVDATSCNNITGTTAVNRYWVGDTGNWSDTAHWSATDGGSSGATAPLVQDDVFFTANSFTTTGKTVTCDLKWLCRNFDASAVGSDNPTFSMSATIVPNIDGSLILASGSTLSGSAFALEGSGSHTITQNGATWSAACQTLSAGTYTLGSDLSIAATFTIVGNFNAANYNLTTSGNFAVNSTGIAATATLTMGSGTWTLTGNGAAWVLSNNNVTANTSTVKFTSTGATVKTFVGAGKTYSTLWFAGGAGASTSWIDGSNTFTELKDTGTAAHTMQFTAASTQTITSFTVAGTAGNVVTINSCTSGGSASTAKHFLVKSGAVVVSSDYLNIQHSEATAASLWYAGTHSTDNQAVATAGSGWVFTAPPSGSTAFFQLF